MTTISHFLIPIVLLLIPVLGYAVFISIGVFVISWLFKSKPDRNLFASCIAPICVWLVGAFLFRGKTFTNLIFEPLILAAVVLVLIVVHAFAIKRGKCDKETLGARLLIISVLAALCVLLFVPAFPE